MIFDVWSKVGTVSFDKSKFNFFFHCCWFSCRGSSIILLILWSIIIIIIIIIIFRFSTLISLRIEKGNLSLHSRKGRGFTVYWWKLNSRLIHLCYENNSKEKWQFTHPTMQILEQTIYFAYTLGLNLFIVLPLCIIADIISIYN